MERSGLRFIRLIRRDVEDEDSIFLFFDIDVDDMIFVVVLYNFAFS